jgi:hypothetical protein
MMENEFRTTFIPKTPLAQQSSQNSAPVSKPVGILFVVAVVIVVMQSSKEGRFNDIATLYARLRESIISVSK